MKRTIAIVLFSLLFVTAFAQRGGGGGARGGRNNNNRQENIISVNDSTPMVRTGASIHWTKGRGSNNPIREDELQERLGEERYAQYESARQLFIKGDNRESIGALIYIPTAIVTVIAASKFDDEPDVSKGLFITAGVALIPATTFFTIGHTKKVQAKRQLDDIVKSYNDDLEQKNAERMQLKVAPTAMLQYDNQLSVGATIQFSF